MKIFLETGISDSSDVSYRNRLLWKLTVVWKLNVVWGKRAWLAELINRAVLERDFIGFDVRIVAQTLAVYSCHKLSPFCIHNQDDFELGVLLIRRCKLMPWWLVLNCQPY